MTMPLARICTSKFLLQASLAAAFVALSATPALAQRPNLSVFVDCEQPAKKWVDGLKPVVPSQDPRPVGGPPEGSIKRLLVTSGELEVGSDHAPGSTPEKEARLKAELRDQLETAIRRNIGGRGVPLEVAKVRDSVTGKPREDRVKVEDSDAWVFLTVAPTRPVIKQRPIPSIFGLAFASAPVRAISLQCTISVQDHHNVALYGYSETLTVEERGTPGTNGGADDFVPQEQIWADLVNRHADRFVNEVLGFKGRREFRLVDADSVVSEAAGQLAAGNAFKAIDLAVTHWQMSQLTDHRAAFVGAVAYLHLGRPDLAIELCGEAEKNARFIGESAAPCQDLRLFVYQGLKLSKAGDAR